MAQHADPARRPRQSEPQVSALRAADPPTVDLRRRVPAVAVEVPAIRRAVLASAAAHGIAEAPRADIALAVTEACANVVTHAYLDTPAPGPLAVEAYRDNRQFVVVVADEGTGMAPRAHSPGLGVGLSLIARLTQRLEIAGNGPTGAKVVMAFDVAGV
jgi:anti-sigma regulatory factor (Ser/Thr protein kinase)